MGCGRVQEKLREKGKEEEKLNFFFFWPEKLILYFVTKNE